MTHTDEMTDLQRAVLRVHRAMMKMPFAASTSMPYRPLSEYREIGASGEAGGIVALERTAEWMEGLATVLRAYSDRHEGTISELYQLKDQRDAVRAFFGTGA